MNINSHDDQSFLNRLSAIIEANLNNEKFGVSELAREFGKSRSYIHLRLKALTGESGSRFIRRVRLEKALDLIKKNNLTVAEIAYEVGFGSPSYFIKRFHEHYGYSPGEYAQKENENSDVQESKVTFSEVGMKNKSILRRKWLLLVFVLIVVLAFFASKYLLPINQPNDVEKSIAVLPLQNLGGNDEMQGLADGIMEDIRTRLSHLDGLEVKSK
ncbi:MAG: helix-turn-helix domain-containing protein, partial [Mariniphaga sp.]|nr:helix-turn-helix domain-containing protein [Mariniphaga sp.]